MECPSVLSLLCERPGRRPDDTAFSFTDYERDWAGVNQTLTRGNVTAAISKWHGLNVADLVLVQPESIPVTTSGKIRAAGLEQAQQQFVRLDA